MTNFTTQTNEVLNYGLLYTFLYINVCSIKHILHINIYKNKVYIITYYYVIYVYKVYLIHYYILLYALYAWAYIIP